MEENIYSTNENVTHISYPSFDRILTSESHLERHMQSKRFRKMDKIINVEAYTF